MELKKLHIEGMSCDHCIMAVKKELSALDNLTLKKVSIGQALVELEPDQVSERVLSNAVESAGYKLSAVK